MAYYADKVTNIDVNDIGGSAIITANVADGYETVQLYVAGNLVDYSVAIQGLVRFIIPIPGDTDPIFLLSVDAADAFADYWTDAFPEAAASGNRISVQVPTVEAMQVGWRWRVSIDDVIQYEADIFPSGDGAGGWGVQWGTAYGHGPFGEGYGKVWGTNWGHGGGVVLKWVSDPLVNGTYSVDVAILDKALNVSTETTSSVTIASYPRPAKDLIVAGYVSGTDTLSLTWTESEDI